MMPIAAEMEKKICDTAACHRGAAWLGRAGQGDVCPPHPECRSPKCRTLGLWDLVRGGGVGKVGVQWQSGGGPACQSITSPSMEKSGVKYTRRPSHAWLSVTPRATSTNRISTGTGTVR